MKRDQPQRGQVVVIAALVLFVICGVIALAVDYALLTNQHRNIQAFVDQSALAGAAQLNPSGSASLPARELSARRTAFIYFRDNLAQASGSPPIALTALSACWGASSATQFSADIQGCPLPAPYDNYSVSICAPAEDSANGTPCSNPISGGTSISMRVTESVATGFARLLGVSTATSGGFGAAEFSANANNTTGAGAAGNGGSGGSPTSGGSQSTSSGTNLVKGSRFPFGLWSDGCMTIHDLLEIFAADVYVNKCSLLTTAPVGGAICVESTPASAGNLVFGPTAIVPTSPIPSVSQTVASCMGASNGAIFSMGQVPQDTHGQWSSPPAYTPPPGWGANPFPSPWPGVAQHNNPCKNGTKDSNGVSPDGSSPTIGCYNPGTYASILDIHNNLNPGVYNVLGPDRTAGTPACDATAAGCQAVIFKGNTMNANWADVGDRCWAAPDTPTTGAFNWPCPDGYVLDPQAASISDPQCAGSTYTNPLGPPTGPINDTASAVPGSLTTPAKFFVRVTQLNAMGESTSSETSVTLAAAQTSFDVSIPGSGSFNIYISKAATPAQTVGNNEILAIAAAGPGTTNIKTFPASTSMPYPLFDTTACRGFRNIPSRPPAYPQPQTTNVNQLENYGVTFNLYYGTSMCLDNVCGGSDQATVLLSPFCASLASGNSALTPPALYGTSCFPGRNQYEADPSLGPIYTGGGWINDGAFVVYGSGYGKILALDSRERIGLTGAIYAPAMRLSITRGTTFSLIGQAFVGSAEFATASSTLAPLIYYPCCSLASQTGNTTGGSGGGANAQTGGPGNGPNGPNGIIGPQSPAVVRLIR
jgi:hypothetical protein